jgi:hypothetical protein
MLSTMRLMRAARGVAQRGGVHSRFHHFRFCRRSIGMSGGSSRLICRCRSGELRSPSYTIVGEGRGE